MNNIHSEFIKADKLLEEFARKNNKFQDRYTALLTDMNEYIKKSKYENKVVVNELILGYALVDYFEDIRRLKVFHNVEHINSIKIIAYTSYWLLRRKPIQVIEREKELIYVNEKFVLAYILDSLSNDEKGNILLRNNAGLKSFKESLLYFLKYRYTSATSLELMIMAFFSGQIYQETDEDLSSILAKYR